MPAIELTNPAALPADWRDLLALTKPRVMYLVVFTGLCGLLAAPTVPALVLCFTAILCIALGAGASTSSSMAGASGRATRRGRVSGSRSPFRRHVRAP